MSHYLAGWSSLLMRVPQQVRRAFVRVEKGIFRALRAQLQLETSALFSRPHVRAGIRRLSMHVVLHPTMKGSAYALYVRVRGGAEAGSGGAIAAHAAASE